MNDLYAIVRSLLLEDDIDSRHALADVAEERGDMEMVRLLREGLPVYYVDEDPDFRSEGEFGEVWFHSHEARQAYMSGVGDDSTKVCFESMDEMEGWLVSQGD